jgi:hypothetical protein
MKVRIKVVLAASVALALAGKAEADPSDHRVKPKFECLEPMGLDVNGRQQYQAWFGYTARSMIEGETEYAGDLVFNGVTIPTVFQVGCWSDAFLSPVFIEPLRNNEKVAASVGDQAAFVNFNVICGQEDDDPGEEEECPMLPDEFF